VGDFQTAGLQTDRLGDEEDRRCVRALAAGDDEAELLQVADPGPGPVEALLGQPSAHGLVRQVTRLPAALRDVLVLAFDQRMTYEEIAEVLEIPAGTVRSRLHEVRSRPRPHLGSGGP
jgi:RNA polymerase sigma-70 factor (ECF subfamily)